MHTDFLTDEQLFEWLQVCRTLQSLKELTRQGSVASGIGRGDSDSVAAHTSLVGMLALTLAWELRVHDQLHLDPARVAAMALVHDLSSAILGDINSDVKQYYFPDYTRGERLAFQDLVSGLQSANELLELYDEAKACQSTGSRIVRFADGLDSWLEVVPRASLAWMQQHKDYRERVLEQLKGDEIYGDRLAEMFQTVCKTVESHQIGPKRPGALLPDGISDSSLISLDGCQLPNAQLAEWLAVCQTLQRLKRLTRQGFITSGGFNRWDTDAIADHIGLVALMSLTLAMELGAHLMGVDPYHVAALALVHDLGEAILGDVNSETKQRYFTGYGNSENSAVRDLVGQLLAGDQLLALYAEFDACETTAAKIVRFADSLDAWQLVTTRPANTWMAQHVEYRNRTFQKLKGDRLLGDSLAELFLRACLVLQGQPVGPKRSAGRVEGETPDFAGQITAEISQSMRKLRQRQRETKDVLSRDPDLADRETLARREDTLNAELAHASQTLIFLKEKLLRITAQDIKSDD